MLCYLNLRREHVVLWAPQQQAGLAAVCGCHPFDFGDDGTLNGFIGLLVALLDYEDPPAGNQHVTVCNNWMLSSVSHFNCIISSLCKTGSLKHVWGVELTVIFPSKGASNTQTGRGNCWVVFTQAAKPGQDLWSCAKRADLVAGVSAVCFFSGFENTTENENE